MLRNREDARDVVQSLFMDLLQRGETDLELPYLYRAVTNRCLNMLRDRAVHARLLHAAAPTLPTLVRTTCEDRAIDFDLLVKLCRELDDAHAELLVFRYVDDLSQDEIAELTGTSRKTVGKRLARVQQAVQRVQGSAGGAA